LTNITIIRQGRIRIGILNFIFFSESNIESIVNRFVCFLSPIINFLSRFSF